MSFKTMLMALPKYLALVVLYLIVFMLSSASISTGIPWTPSPEQQPWILVGMALVALVNTLVVSLIIVRSNWNGWRLSAAMMFAWYGVMTFMSQIETAWFAPALGVPSNLAFIVALQAIPLVVIFTLAAVFVWGQWREATTLSDTHVHLPLTVVEWAWKLAVIAALYLVLYFGFGYVVAWQNPILREMYGNGANQDVFNNARLIPFQILRSALWVLFALPVIRMTRGPLWQVALLVGLLYALPMNIVHAIPNPIMPDASVRLSHFIETATSNFIFGLAVTGLLHWRPGRATLKAAQPAKP